MIAIEAESSQDTSLVPLGGTAGEVLGFLHGGSSGSLDVPKPFSEPILIIPSTRVAGTTHIEDIDIIVDELEEGAELRFEREAGNLHDHWAIIVHDPRGRKMGYVPADENEVIARLMDGGKRIYGVFRGVELLGRWYKIEMEVYFDD